MITGNYSGAAWKYDNMMPDDNDYVEEMECTECGADVELDEEKGTCPKCGEYCEFDPDSIEPDFDESDIDTQGGIRN